MFLMGEIGLGLRRAKVRGETGMYSRLPSLLSANECDERLTIYNAATVPSAYVATVKNGPQYPH